VDGGAGKITEDLPFRTGHPQPMADIGQGLLKIERFEVVADRNALQKLDKFGSL
jgi:hypothetical protein